MLNILILNVIFWIIFACILIISIRNRKISLEYSVSWLIIIVLVLFATSSVRTLDRIASFLGIAYPPALLIMITFYLQVIILLYQTKLISKINIEKKNLMQDYLISKANFLRQSDVLIIIPVYNEAQNISKVVNSIRELYDYDIIVINDGSSDRTEKILATIRCNYLSHPYNSGYGVSLETGYKYASKMGYQYIIQMDGDGQHDSSSIKLLLNSIQEDESDVIIGSRFLAQDGHYKPEFLRNVGISIFRCIIKILLKKNYSDPTSGFQILNKRVIEFYTKDNRFPEKYPDANMIILLNRRGFVVNEVPVIMHPNESNVSMHNGILKQIFYAIYMMLSIIIVYFQAKNYKEAAHKNNILIN